MLAETEQMNEWVSQSLVGTVNGNENTFFCPGVQKIDLLNILHTLPILGPVFLEKRNKLLPDKMKWCWFIVPFQQLWLSYLCDM